MSQSSDSIDQNALKLLQLTFFDNCLTFSLTTLQVYEYLTTVDQEVELVWKRKTRFSLPSILLVSTRACMVVNAILTLIAPTTCTESVKILEGLVNILDFAGFIQVALFSALRVSALYDRNIALLVSVFLLGLVPVGTNIFKFVRTTYIQEPGACLADSNVSDALTKKLVSVTRIPVIVADLLVLTLTWARTYKQILLSRGDRISIPLSTCLARDGGLYFLILLVINILQLATFRTHIGGPVSIIVSTLPPVLINRFMLNLRQAGSDPNPSSSGNPDHSTMSIPRFQLSDQVVGSMGEPLEHGGLVAPGEEDNEVYGDNAEVERHSSQREERQGSQEQSA